MKITRSSSLREIAFLVCTALDRNGITAVLSGGSAATIWAPEAVQSRDLDFVLQLQTPKKPGVEVLAELGYRMEGSEYVHRESEYTIDFPRGPLTIGSEPITRWATLREGGLLLHIINPTDSCLDRLAGFIHWNDRGGLEQALAVARANRTEIEFEAIAGWCRKENASHRYEEFSKRVGP